MAAQLGVAGSEIFPKQVEVLADRGDMGNWIVMPYYGDTFGGKLREQVGLRKTGAELTVDQFLKLAEERKVDPRWIEERAKIAPRPSVASKKAKTGNTATDAGGPFSDGPVCLQTLVENGGARRGGQNNALLSMMGIYFKRKNPDGWKKDLDYANQHYLTPAGSRRGWRG